MQCVAGIGVVIGIIVYKMSVLSALYLQEQEIIYKNAGIVTSATAACINLVAIFILNFVSIPSPLNKTGKKSIF